MDGEDSGGKEGGRAALLNAVAVCMCGGCFPGGSVGKESACSAEDPVQSLGGDNPLEEEMAIHSSILAWKIPWTEETGGLQSMGSQKFDTTERLSMHTCNG